MDLYISKDLRLGPLKYAPKDFLNFADVLKMIQVLQDSRNSLENFVDIFQDMGP